MGLRTGILLMNTGTPADPSVEAVRTYLAEFLADPMLISAPRIVWKPILNHVILPRRPLRSAPLYEKLWTDEGFPLAIYTQRQCDLIDATLRERGFCDGDFQVEFAMRYGEPSAASALETLKDAGCGRIVVVPMYPQEVRVCAGTCFKHVRDCLVPLRSEGWNPEVIEVPSFYNQPAYLEAIAQSISDAWTYEPGAHLLLSWHSTPLADIERKGDPYRDQNEFTAQSVTQALGIPADDWSVVYQSRFDSRRWLSPFCDKKLLELAARGVTNVCVVCPGFVCDCLETLIEVDEKMRELYLAAAPEGSTFTFVHSLNDGPGLVEAVVAAILEAVPEGLYAGL